MRTLPFLFFLFILSLLLSTFFSQVQYQSLLQTSLYLLIPLSFIAGLMLGSSKHLIFFLKFLSILISLVTLYYFYKEYQPNPTVIASGRRFLGPFGWHNQQAALLIFTLPLTFYFYYKIKNKVWFLISLINLFFLMITYSRASWLSLILSIIIYFPLNYHTISKLISKKIILAISFFITAILIFTPTCTRLLSFVHLASTNNHSTSERLRTEALFVGIEMIKDLPVIGLGPGVYGLAYPAYQKTPWLYTRFPHNQFLQYFVELGVIGGLIIFIIYYQILINIYHNQEKIFHRQINHALFISALSLLIHSALDIDQNYALFIIFLWLSTGILYQQIVPNTLTRFHFLIIPLTILILSLNLYLKLTPDPYYQDLKSLKFDQALKQNPYSAEPHFFKALNFESLRNYQSAQLEYLKAIQKNPYSHPKYHMNLAALELTLNNSQAAELILFQATQYFPKNQDYQALSHLENQNNFDKDLQSLYTAYDNVKRLNQQ